MTPPTHLDLSGLDFLIVDDNQFIRQLMNEILKSFGVKQIREASDAESAKREVEARSPDLILCDWMMRPFDGLDFLRKLRNEQAGQRIPVIMISGHATADHVAAALGEGADSYIVKPFRPSTLMMHLIKVITMEPLVYV